VFGVSNRFSRMPLVIGLVLPGLVLCSAGLFLLDHLSHVYRTVDLAYRQSEQTFYDWLAPTIRKHGLKSDFLAKIIAQRLLIMSRTDRRDAVNSMMIDVFWDELAPPGTERQPIFALMEKTTRLALASDPLSGELWLFAAWLRTKMNGFDDKVSDYFVLSQRFTPRESALVLQRLDFVIQFHKALSPEVRAATMADLSLVQNINLKLANQYAKQLQQ
jgi:hypothetical protein